MDKISRKQQAENTKSKLLEISLRMIAEEGYDRVKISDICNAAGVSVGAFYHHFQNKAGIVIYAYLKCDDYFETEIYPEFKERHDKEAICDYLDYQMQYALNYGVDMVTQIYKAQLTDGTDFFLSLDRGLPKGLIHMISNLQKNHVISDEFTASHIAQEILLISRGVIYNWCQLNGSYDLKEYNRQIISRYLNSYFL